MQTDAVVPFVFEMLPVRGAIIQMQQSWHRMLLGHSYAPPVRDVLGHAAAATALLAQSLKFDGAVTMQLNGDGPLSLLVMQCTNNLELRGMASSSGVATGASFADLAGKARCAITIDAGAMEQPYQGIVEVSNESLAASLENYYTRSAQIPSHLHLVCNESVCGGILLQQMPEKMLPVVDDWHRVGLLASTLRTLDIEKGVSAGLLARLFAEDDLRVFDGRPLVFRCRCSGQRAEEILRLLGESETRAALEERGRITVTCEYCGRQRRFDTVDISRIFSAQAMNGSDALH
ncbi:MAG: Hsp33 family molecular chaperone HslO [Gammaproteobacteria bacterium]|nr:Hsp33 family molecular chaperone HslO [Gammaproteobacteria bacterium]